MLGGGSAANTACWLASTGSAGAPRGRRRGRRPRAVGARRRSSEAGVTFAGARRRRRRHRHLRGAGRRGRRAHDAPRPRRQRRAAAPRSSRPRWRRRRRGCTCRGTRCSATRSRPAGLGRGARREGRRLAGRSTQPAPPRCVPRRSRPVPAVDRGLRPCCSRTTTSWRRSGGQARALAAAAEVVAKHGPGGATWTDGQPSVTAPAPAVAVVSTVGAGDAFDAGFLDARLAGCVDAEQALAAGGRLAARALAHAGARPPHPMRP